MLIICGIVQIFQLASIESYSFPLTRDTCGVRPRVYCNLRHSPRGVERLLVGAALQPGEAVEGEADEGGGEDCSVRDNPAHRDRDPCLM